MAIVVYTAQDCKVGLALQATWGTAIADGGAFTELECDAVTIDRDIKDREGTANHGSRVRDYLDMQSDKKLVTPKATLKGIVNDDLIDILLYAWNQQVIEVASPTPYKKTLTLTYGTTQPDFSANGGCFFTLCNNLGLAASSEKILDCIIEKLKLICEPGKKLMYEASIIGREAAVEVSTPSGTWTRLPAVTGGYSEYFDYSMLTRQTINFGAGAVSPVLTGGWELELSQKVTPIGQDGVGNYQTFVLSERGGTFKGKILWDSSALSAQSNRGSGTGAIINLGWGGGTAGATHRDLDFILYGKFKSVKPVIGDVNSAEIEYKLLTDKTNTAAAMVAISANAILRSWPTS